MPAPRRAALPAWALPLLLLALLAAAGAWRLAHRTPAHAVHVDGVRTSARTFGTARLDVPRSWVTLDRTAERITWGEPDRSHTVTLAATEAGADPLPGVVAAAAADSAAHVPGTRVVGRPVELVLDHASRGDVALLARYEVTVGTRGTEPLAIAQSWRRDTRAGMDLVATWTSADGAWPVSPRSTIPESTTSG